MAQQKELKAKVASPEKTALSAPAGVAVAERPQEESRHVVAPAPQADSGRGFRSSVGAAGKTARQNSTKKSQGVSAPEPSAAPWWKRPFQRKKKPN
jgi:hypothetical protein